MKWFLQFVVYTGLAAIYLSLLMFLAFYHLLSAKKPKTHMNKAGYPYAFIACILAFVEGLLFAFFTYELLTEQIESIEDNQSYIDDLKAQYGVQMDFFDNAKSALGQDWLWWLVPTRPELRVNFFERVWPKKEVKRMYKTETFDREQEDSDPDKKAFAAEQRAAQREKKVMWVLFLAGVLGWFFFL